MSISVQCPGCEKKLKAKDELAGKRVKCPNCAQLVVVPSVCSAPLQPTPPNPSPRKSPPRSGHVTTASPTPQSRPVRWPWYAGGGAAFLCVLAVVISIFAMPGKDRTPAKNEMAAVTPPESKPEPTPEPKPELKPEPPERKPEPKRPEERAASEKNALDEKMAAEERAADVGSATPQHFRTVLVLRFGKQQYEPGTIFHIEPQKDDVIKGNCELKFTCIRRTGEPITPPYGICTAIVAKSEFSGEEMSMTNKYNTKVAKDGSISVDPTFTWPVAQRETQIDFPVSFGDSGPFSSRKIHGKGWVYFFLDDGKGKPLSNIVSVESDVPR